MGLDDPAVFVDRLVELRCPRGHVLRRFQTSDLDGSATSTYLVHGDRLYLAEAADAGPPLQESPEVWREEGGGVVREHRFRLHEICGSRTVQLYGTCEVCELDTAWQTAPRNDVSVRFQLTFRPGTPLLVERIPSRDASVPS